MDVIKHPYGETHTLFPRPDECKFSLRGEGGKRSMFKEWKQQGNMPLPLTCVTAVKTSPLKSFRVMKWPPQGQKKKKRKKTRSERREEGKILHENCLCRGNSVSTHE